MKVFNIGNRPLVYSRNFDGVQCIHPKKYLTFGEDEGKKLIKKFDNAVSEKDFNKHMESLKTTKKDK